MTTAATTDSVFRTGFAVVASVVVGVGLAIVAATVLGPRGLVVQLQILNPLQIDLTSGNLPLVLSFSFLAGATMILTPCGYPLLFALTGVSARTTTRSWLHSLPPFVVGIVGAMAVVGVVISLLGGLILSVLLQANLIPRVTLSAVVYGSLGVFAILIGFRSLGLMSFLPPFPGLQAISQLFSVRAMWVKGLDRRMFTFGALYGGGMAAGCPVPVYWALLFWVAVTGNPVLGALVLGVHALGYAAPVLALVILSRMGISAIKSRPRGGERLQKFVSAAVLTTGVFLVSLYVVIRLGSTLI